jgi:hypothetical protein
VKFVEICGIYFDPREVEVVLPPLRSFAYETTEVRFKSGNTFKINKSAKEVVEAIERALGVGSPGAETLAL